MYRILFVLAIVVVIMIQFTGCKKEDAITNSNNYIIPSLNGKIENWAVSSNQILKLGKPGGFTFLEFGNSMIAASGNFNMNLINPSDLIMAPIIEILMVDSSLNLQIKNSQTRGIDCYLNIFSNNTTDPSGEVIYSNYSQNNGTGYFRVSYIYSEGIIEISGSETKIINFDNFNGSKVTDYDIHLKKGWNPLVYKILEQTISGTITTYCRCEWSNEIPSNGKWYYRFY